MAWIQEYPRQGWQLTLFLERTDPFIFSFSLGKYLNYCPQICSVFIAQTKRIFDIILIILSHNLYANLYSGL